jgi:hypothetical protein
MYLRGNLVPLPPEQVGLTNKKRTTRELSQLLRAYVQPVLATRLNNDLAVN